MWSAKAVGLDEEHGIVPLAVTLVLFTFCVSALIHILRFHRKSTELDRLLIILSIAALSCYTVYILQWIALNSFVLLSQKSSNDSNRFEVVCALRLFTPLWYIAGKLCLYCFFVARMYKIFKRSFFAVSKRRSAIIVSMIVSIYVCIAIGYIVGVSLILSHLNDSQYTSLWWRSDNCTQFIQNEINYPLFGALIFVSVTAEIVISIFLLRQLIRSVTKMTTMAGRWGTNPMTPKSVSIADREFKFPDCSGTDNKSSHDFTQRHRSIGGGGGSGGSGRRSTVTVRDVQLQSGNGGNGGKGGTKAGEAGAAAPPRQPPPLDTDTLESSTPTASQSRGQSKLRRQSSKVIDNVVTRLTSLRSRALSFETDDETSVENAMWSTLGIKFSNLMAISLSTTFLSILVYFIPTAHEYLLTIDATVNSLTLYLTFAFANRFYRRLVCCHKSCFSVWRFVCCVESPIKPNNESEIAATIRHSRVSSIASIRSETPVNVSLPSRRSAAGPPPKDLRIEKPPQLRMDVASHSIPSYLNDIDTPVVDDEMSQMTPTGVTHMSGHNTPQFSTPVGSGASRIMVPFQPCSVAEESQYSDIHKTEARLSTISVSNVTTLTASGERSKRPSLYTVVELETPIVSRHKSVTPVSDDITDERTPDRTASPPISKQRQSGTSTSGHSYLDIYENAKENPNIQKDIC